MRRIVAISDLHIGGDENPMLGHPDLLADFLGQVAAYQRADGEELELVIHGDFIDFLAVKPYAAWTPDEATALDKLAAVFRKSSALFDQLARCVGRIQRLTFLIGNHDIELALPKVRDALLKRLGTNSHRCVFVCNNEAYRVGDLLIEHGNRYDSWNAIDYDGLREVVSCTSRGEIPPKELRICPGAELVHEVMNPLKERYHFIDLLKPEDKLVVLLLGCFEPELRRDIPLIFNSAWAYSQEIYRRANWMISGRSPAPGQRHLVGRQKDEKELPSDVSVAFSDELALFGPRRAAGNGPKWQRFFQKDPRDGLRARFEREESVDDRTLYKLRTALRAKLQSDRTFDENNPGDQYCKAASAMIAKGIAKVVVMGHTHLRRNVKVEGGLYLNTGTWADLIRLDESLLREDKATSEQFVDWLRRLSTNQLDGIRQCFPTYADVSVSDDGRIMELARPMMRSYSKDSPFI